jgi:hypothetical protein
VRVALAILTLAVVACDTLTPDPPAPYKPNPLGTGLRLAQVQDPTSPDYRPTSTAPVDVSSTVVTWLDTYDETMDGKSVGTLYVQDVGSQAPYAGIGIFEPNYVPASLSVLPGDVLDFSGPYTEETSIGSATFSTGTFLPQLSKPVGTYRYDFVPPPPVVLTVAQLDGSASIFKNARQWMGMLATLNDVWVAAGSDNEMRVTYDVGASVDGGEAALTASPVAIDNELYALSSTQFPSGTHFSSITGIVTWFFSFHIAPRAPGDLVP